MDIFVHNEQSLTPIQVDTIKPIVLSVLDLEKVQADELYVYFIEEDKMCEVHDHFFKDPTPTDCISIQVDLPGDSPCFLGEIFISPQAAIDYITESNSSFAEELTLYLVHGLLHLIGYDDLEEDDRKKMRLAEKRLMDYLKAHQLLIKL